MSKTKAAIISNPSLKRTLQLTYLTRTYPTTIHSSTIFNLLVYNKRLLYPNPNLSKYPPTKISKSSLHLINGTSLSK
jgi:CRISPR/Cas system CSM-associated protein Csm4 (group 5 of RAMP superfamily)